MSIGCLLIQLLPPQVLIEHSGFQKQQSVAIHDQGWDNYIQGFKLFLSQAM